jgi:hypothetical protein
VPLTFDLTFDYLCPFARNAAEFVIDGLEHGADWDVTFTPYSLAQGHTEEGEPAIWEQDNHDRRSGILALQVGLAVQDRFPDAFPAAHRELFALRHDRGEDLRDRDAIRKALDAADVDPDAVFEAVAAGTYLDVLRTEHERNVEVHGVWGVPTFIAGDRAVFVRFMDRPSDGTAAIERIERVVDMVANFHDLNEFKQVNIPQ